MIQKTSSGIPHRDFAPEHTKRDGGDHGFNNDGPVHLELQAAYKYVSVGKRVRLLGLETSGPIENLCAVELIDALEQLDLLA